MDKHRKVLFVNDEALSVLNLTRENILGKQADEVALKNDLLRRLVRELVQQMKTGTFENLCRQ